MKLNREGRRTVAQFLNSLAAGMLATLILAPIAGGNLRPGLAVGAMLGAILCHGLALHFGRKAG